MANITRIKNNQVTDNTIEYQKLKDGTLVGSKFNANLTLNSNVTILGNLTVANSFAQLNSINTYINDPVVVFNNNYTGSPTYDIGMLINRNLSSLAPYGAVNAAFVWKEASNAFAAIMTTETGTTAGAINNSGFANVFVGNTYANTVTIRDTTTSNDYQTGALIVAGGVGIGGRLSVLGDIGLNGNVITGSGGLQTSVSTGYLFNETATTVRMGGAATTVSIGASTGTTTINNALVTSGVVTLNSNLVAASGTASTNTTTGALVVVGGAGISGAVNTGSTLNVAGISTLSGNVVANSGTASTSATTGALVISGSGGLGVGGAIYNSGVLVSGGNIVAASGTDSTNTTTGALVVTGGAGISGALNVGGISSHTGASTFASTLTASGNIVAASGTASTNTTTGALVVVGGIGASGAIYAGSVQNTPVGSSTPNTGAFTTLTANGLTTVTNTTESNTSGDGALVVSGGTGIAKNLNVGGNVVITGNLTVQGAQTIIGTTDLAVIDAVINIHTNANLAPLTSNDGKDIGIKMHYYDTQDSHAALIRDNATGALEWYGRGIEGSGNVFQGNAYGVIKTGEYVAANATPSTSTTTGALRVAGGAGIVGDVYAGSIQNTPIGNATASTGRFTTVTTTGVLTSAGNIVANSGTASTSTTTGAIVTTGGLGVAGAIYNGGIHVSLGNIVAASGTASTDTTSGALVVAGGIGASGDIYAGGIQNTPVGSSTPNTGAFTTLTTSGTTIASGNLVAAATTESVDTTTGALVVRGGAGIASNVIIGGNIVITSNTQAFDLNAGALVVQGGATITNNLNVQRSCRLSGNVVIISVTKSDFPTDMNSGALIVGGDAVMRSNLHVAAATIFNSNRVAGFDHIVQGTNDTSLIWARSGSAYDQVLIGNSATVGTLVRGAKLQINSTDSMLIPTGTNAQRPSSTGGTDVVGMFRYNTTVNALEIYDGSEWDQITTQFTVIVSEQFAGDDSTTVFTMAGSSTTAATIVSINGVIQIPTSAYSVSGTTLTFTEAPATGDVIDVRRLATTSVVQGIASVNGYMQFLVDNSGAYVYTGSTNTSVATYWEPGGAQVTQGANVSVSTANVVTGVDSFLANTYRSAIYQAQVTSGTDYQVQTVTVLHNGTTATAVTHGIIQTNGNLGVFDANISSGRVYLNFIPSTSNDVLRIKKDYLLI